MQKNPFKSLLQRVVSILLGSLPSEVESARKARYVGVNRLAIFAFGRTNRGPLRFFQFKQPESFNIMIKENL